MKRPPKGGRISLNLCLSLVVASPLPPPLINGAAGEAWLSKGLPGGACPPGARGPNVDRADSIICRHHLDLRSQRAARDPLSLSCDYWGRENIR